MAFIQIISVSVTEKFKLQVIFSDGIKGIYDVGHLAGKGVFKIWDTGNNFEKVFISPESGAITWPDDVDIDTVKVYSSIKGMSADNFLNNYSHATHL